VIAPAPRYAAARATPCAARSTSRGVTEGVAYKAAHAVPGIGGDKDPPDDVTLAQKVESIAFRKAGVPKGRVNVDADNAVIYLRGQLESDAQIEELVRATHAIEGVGGVKNFLHTPTEGAQPRS
jgi:osmotically-inducible protein OsmY